MYYRVEFSLQLGVRIKQVFGPGLGVPVLGVHL